MSVLNGADASSLFYQIRGPFEANTEYIIPRTIGNTNHNFYIQRVAFQLMEATPLEWESYRTQITLSFENPEISTSKLYIGKTGILELTLEGAEQSLKSFTFNKEQPGGSLVELWLRHI